MFYSDGATALGRYIGHGRGGDGAVALLAELREICGRAHARAAGPGDTVCGVRAGFVATPGSTGELAALVGRAAEHKLGVVPAGGGTKADWGGAPSTVDLIVDTVRLAGWHRHEPGALTATVGAGTRLRDLDPLLRPTGQRLALDPASMWGGGTVGGALAAAETGPLRHFTGPVGNLVDAIEYVDADGSVRTVAGLAAAALCGSLGTLGVIATATLRLHPRPPATVWLRRSVTNPAELYELMLLMETTPLGVAAVEADWPAADPVLARIPRPRAAPEDADLLRPGAAARRPGPGSIAVQIEGTGAGAHDRVSTAATLLGGDAAPLPQPPAWWGRLPGGPDDVLLRLGGPPAALNAVEYTLRDATAGGVSMRGSVGAGVILAALPAHLAAGRVVSIVEATRYTMTGRDGWCTLLRGPAEVHAALRVSDPDVPDAARRKAAADPDGRFAPGRLPLRSRG
jgi:glycolate oxidase FAD binding subunit